MPYKDIIASNEQVRRTLSEVPDELSAVKPDSETWSALECMEHITVVEKGLLNVLAMELTDTAPERMGMEKIRAALANREMRVSAPEFILPKGRFASLREAEERFFRQREKLLDMVNAKVHEHDGVFPHPMLGPMTKLEWIYFTLAHTERHLFQIKDAVALVKSGLNRQD
jgi:hypothetical protein